jgi:aspartate-semialdehyde dehydrogenase
MMKSLRVAVLGATGLVGNAMIRVLAQKRLPISEFYPLASARSAGNILHFNEIPYTVLDVTDFDFSQVDFALFSAGGETAKHYAPIAAAAGCTVIDNSSAFRYEKDIPLIVPEVNLAALHASSSKIIANPNCSTIQMLVALKPIYDAVGIERINIATYQAVSGSGLAGIHALNQGLKAHIEVTVPPSDYRPYQKPIALNVIPHIDVFQENGYTKEEMKMVWETQKILNDPQICVNPTAVRVPVLTGHSEAIHIETRDKISAQAVKDLLGSAQGVVVMDNGDYPTPCMEGFDTDAVYVGRIREDLSHPKGINLWVVADNVRKGAALNAVQILQALI